ncbi:unnamed protein product [Effrenium voratum]|nr:unnamed protein product [Effrenium voratum]
MGDLMVQSAATTLAMGDVYLMLDREVGVRLTGKLEDVRLVLEQVTKKIEEKYKNSPPKDGKELDLFVEKTVTALSLPVVGFSQPPGKKLYKQISGNLGNLMHAMYDRLSLEQRVTDGLNPFGRFDRRQQLEVFAESQKTRAQLQNKINDKYSSEQIKVLMKKPDPKQHAPHLTLNLTTGALHVYEKSEDGKFSSFASYPWTLKKEAAWRTSLEGKFRELGSDLPEARQVDRVKPVGSARSATPNSVMGCSAKEFAQASTSAPVKGEYEWLHRMAHSLNGKDAYTNLVCGSDFANSYMMVFEKVARSLGSGAKVTTTVLGEAASEAGGLHRYAPFKMKYEVWGQLSDLVLSQTFHIREKLQPSQWLNAIVEIVHELGLLPRKKRKADSGKMLLAMGSEGSRWRWLPIPTPQKSNLRLPWRPKHGTSCFRASVALPGAVIDVAFMEKLLSLPDISEVRLMTEDEQRAFYQAGVKEDPDFAKAFDEPPLKDAEQAVICEAEVGGVPCTVRSLLKFKGEETFFIAAAYPRESSFLGDAQLAELTLQKQRLVTRRFEGDSVLEPVLSGTVDAGKLLSFVPGFPSDLRVMLKATFAGAEKMTDVEEGLSPSSFEGSFDPKLTLTMGGLTIDQLGIGARFPWVLDVGRLSRTFMPSIFATGHLTKSVPFRLAASREASGFALTGSVHHWVHPFGLQGFQLKDLYLKATVDPFSLEISTSIRSGDLVDQVRCDLFGVWSEEDGAHLSANVAQPMTLRQLSELHMHLTGGLQPAQVHQDVAHRLLESLQLELATKTTEVAGKTRQPGLYVLGDLYFADHKLAVQVEAAISRDLLLQGTIQGLKVGPFELGSLTLQVHLSQTKTYAVAVAENISIHGLDGVEATLLVGVGKDLCAFAEIRDLSLDKLSPELEWLQVTFDSIAFSQSEVEQDFELLDPTEGTITKRLMAGRRLVGQMDLYLFHTLFGVDVSVNFAYDFNTREFDLQPSLDSVASLGSQDMTARFGKAALFDIFTIKEGTLDVGFSSNLVLFGQPVTASVHFLIMGLRSASVEGTLAAQDPKGVLIGPAEHQLALQQVGVGATILPEPGAIFLEGSLTYRNAKLSAKVQLAEDPDLDGFYFKIENSSLQDLLEMGAFLVGLPVLEIPFADQIIVQSLEAYYGGTLGMIVEGVQRPLGFALDARLLIFSHAVSVKVEVDGAVRFLSRKIRALVDVRPPEAIDFAFQFEVFGLALDIEAHKKGQAVELSFEFGDEHKRQAEEATLRNMLAAVQKMKEDAEAVRADAAKAKAALEQGRLRFRQDLDHAQGTFNSFEGGVSQALAAAEEGALSAEGDAQRAAAEILDDLAREVSKLKADLEADSKELSKRLASAEAWEAQILQSIHAEKGRFSKVVAEAGLNFDRAVEEAKSEISDAESKVADAKAESAKIVVKVETHRCSPDTSNQAEKDAAEQKLAEALLDLENAQQKLDQEKREKEDGLQKLRAVHDENLDRLEKDQEQANNYLGKLRSSSEALESIKLNSATIQELGKAEAEKEHLQASSERKTVKQTQKFQVQRRKLEVEKMLLEQDLEAIRLIIAEYIKDPLVEAEVPLENDSQAVVAFLRRLGDDIFTLSEGFRHLSGAGLAFKEAMAVCRRDGPDRIRELQGLIRAAQPNEELAKAALVALKAARDLDEEFAPLHGVARDLRNLTVAFADSAIPRQRGFSLVGFVEVLNTVSALLERLPLPEEGRWDRLTEEEAGVAYQDTAQVVDAVQGAIAGLNVLTQTQPGIAIRAAWEAVANKAVEALWNDTLDLNAYTLAVAKWRDAIATVLALLEQATQLWEDPRLVHARLAALKEETFSNSIPALSQMFGPINPPLFAEAEVEAASVGCGPWWSFCQPQVGLAEERPFHQMSQLEVLFDQIQSIFPSKLVMPDLEPVLFDVSELRVRVKGLAEPIRRAAAARSVQDFRQALMAGAAPDALLQLQTVFQEMAEQPLVGLTRAETELIQHAVELGAATLERTPLGEALAGLRRILKLNRRASLLQTRMATFQRQAKERAGHCQHVLVETSSVEELLMHPAPKMTELPVLQKYRMAVHFVNGLGQLCGAEGVMESPSKVSVMPGELDALDALDMAVTSFLEAFDQAPSSRLTEALRTVAQSLRSRPSEAAKWRSFESKLLEKSEVARQTSQQVACLFAADLRGVTAKCCKALCVAVALHTTRHVEADPKHLRTGRLQELRAEEAEAVKSIGEAAGKVESLEAAFNQKIEDIKAASAPELEQISARIANLERQLAPTVEDIARKFAEAARAESKLSALQETEQQHLDDMRHEVGSAVGFLRAKQGRLEGSASATHVAATAGSAVSFEAAMDAASADMDLAERHAAAAVKIYEELMHSNPLSFGSVQGKASYSPEDIKFFLSVHMDLRLNLDLGIFGHLVIGPLAVSFDIPEFSLQHILHLVEEAFKRLWAEFKKELKELI